MKQFFLFLLLWLSATAPGSVQSAPPPDLTTRLEALRSQGNGEATYHLGMIYHLGLDGVAQDSRKALELFRLAAERGDPLGAYKLGCYYAGQGGNVIKPDEALALRYKLIAAEAGYALAQEEVARIYFQRGDIESGIRWLEAAARQGGFGALMGLGGLYSGLVPGIHIEKDAVRFYAFTMLALRDSEDEFADLKDGMERELRRTMSADEIARAEAMMAGWQAVRSPLTLKADSGLDAARQLAGLR